MKSAVTSLFALIIFAAGVLGQSSSFNYQGKLNDSGSAATGTYQFQFKLYDALDGGSQIGNGITDVSVNVSGGVFTTVLDFGAAAFDGSDRYLEVAVRKTAGEFYTTLTPRQKIVSTPYATRAAVAGTALNFTGNLAGDVSGSQSSTVVNSVGGQSAANVATGVQAANAATASNTANTIVKRDASGKFAAAGITFADNTTLTSANVNAVVNGTNAISAINDAATAGTISEARLSTNVFRFSPTAPQLFVGDANGTSPMINLRGQSTCCGGSTGFADFKVFQNGSFVATGNLGIGVSPMEGKGYRTSWHTYKGAFRSGYADNEWDDVNVGFFSWAGGSNSTASGLYSFSFGDTNFARNTSSIAFGSGNEVKGAAGFAAGAGSRVCDTYGVAFGNKAISGGPILADGKCDPDTYNITGLAAIAMGYNVTASQDHTIALGKFASNNGFSGTFVWSDGSATAAADTFKNTANNEFAARATGGFRFRTNLAGTTGCNLPAGSGVFNCTSSRYTKENFTPVSGRDILSRLRMVPVTSWNYISEGQTVRHLGPMAEDFWEQFQLGVGNKSIGIQDMAGVSIAAVKELDNELQQKNAEIERLRNEVNQLKASQNELEKRLEAIEKAVNRQQ